MQEMKKLMRTLGFSPEETTANEMVLDLADQISESELEPYGSEIDEHGVKFDGSEVIFPPQILKAYNKASQNGLCGITVPEEYEGSELSYTLYCAVVDRFSRANASYGVIPAVHATPIELLLKLGTEEAKDEFLPKLASGEFLGAMAFTESEAGSDIASVRTTAEKDGNGDYLISGTKIFITHAGLAGVYVILVSTDRSKGAKGLSAFIVPANSEGLEIVNLEKKMGLHASSTGQLAFDNVRVPKEYLLGRENQGYREVLSGLSSSRIAIGAQAVGIADAARRRAVKYSRERIQGGRPISEYQGVSFQLAEMSTGITAGRTLYMAAACIKDRDIGTWWSEASKAKLFCSEMAQKVTYDAVQIHGGYGYVADYEVERFSRDARITTIYEGTTEIQKRIIARDELKQWIE